MSSALRIARRVRSCVARVAHWTRIKWRSRPATTRDWVPLLLASIRWSSLLGSADVAQPVDIARVVPSSFQRTRHQPLRWRSVRIRAMMTKRSSPCDTRAECASGRLGLGALSLCDVRGVIIIVALRASHHGGLYARCVPDCALRCVTLMLRFKF